MLYNRLTGLINTPFDETISKKSASEQLASAKKILDNFFFVGITENFAKDSQWICDQIGIKNYNKKVNASHKYYKPTNYREVKEMIYSKNKLDFKLYQYAKKVNRQQKKALEI